MLQNFHAISMRRKIIASLLALSVLGTGILSWAAITDTLNINGEFSTASIDLTANGEQSLTIQWPAGYSGQPYTQVYAVDLANEGTVELRYAITSTATYSPPVTNGWTGVAFTIHSVPDAASCTVAGTNAGNALAGATGGLGGYVVGSPAAGAQAGDRNLASDGSEFLCLKVSHGAPVFGENDSATQTITFSAEATGL